MILMSVVLLPSIKKTNIKSVQHRPTHLNDNVYGLRVVIGLVNINTQISRKCQEIGPWKARYNIGQTLTRRYVCRGWVIPNNTFYNQNGLVNLL